MYFRGYRAKKLTDNQFNELRTRLENAFTIRRKRIDDNKTYYELDGCVNRMGWLDSGTIELRKTEEIVIVKFAVSSVIFPVKIQGWVCGFRCFLLYSTRFSLYSHTSVSN